MESTNQRIPTTNHASLANSRGTFSTIDSSTLSTFFLFLEHEKKNKFFFKLGRKAGRGTVDRIASFTIGPALLFWSMETFGLLVQIDAHRLDFCSFQSVRGHRHRFGHHQTAPAARPTAELGRAHRRRQPVRPYRVFFFRFFVWFGFRSRIREAFTSIGDTGHRGPSLGTWF